MYYTMSMKQFLLMCVCIVAAVTAEGEKCPVTENDINIFETAWTDYNPDVQPGYELNPGEVLHVSECKECLCLSNGSLSCSEDKTPRPTDDPCVIITCTPQYELKTVVKTESCNCTEHEELVVVPAPACCECRTRASKCTVTDDDLFPFESAWTESNTDVQAGDELNPGELLHISDCKECLCAANGSLSCSARKTQVPHHDPCVIVTCTAGYERHPFFKAKSCRCAKDEHIVVVPAPVCCKCHPGRPPNQKGYGH